MAKEKMQAQRGVTPAGTSVYSKWMYEKDTRFTGGDETKAKFQGWIVFDKGDEATEPFVQERIARHKQAKGKDDNCPVKDGDARERKAKEDDVKAGKADEVDEMINDEQFDGKWLVKFTTKNAPSMFDAFKRKLTPDVAKIMPGDTVRFQFKENPREEGSMRGCYLYLDGVQLLEKNATGSGGGDMFDVVDGGFQAPEAEAEGESTGGGGDF